MSVNSTNVETENEKEEKEGKEFNETTDYINKDDNRDKVLGEEKSLKTNIAKNYTDEKANNDNEISNDYNNNQNDNSQDDTEIFIVPNDLQKTLKLTLFLAILGISLIILGLVKIIIGWGPMNGNMILILGSIIFIPGGYYSFQFFRAKVAKFEYIRKEIFDSIPRL